MNKIMAGGFMAKNSDKYLTIIMGLMVTVFIPLIFGLLSLYLGRDVNWDLKNYHYYNAYAFLENRMDFDVAPAQLQTYINPISDVPFYWLTKNFPSWVSGFVLGAVHGFNLSLVFLIFWILSKIANTWLKMFLGISIVAVSGIAPGFISELGNTMNDNLTSIFVLSAVYLLILALNSQRQKSKYGPFQVGLAGLVIGLGVGIKPSIAIFALSSAIVFCAFQSSWRDRILSLAVYGLTGLTGGLLSAGFWWWRMWLGYGNPLFPFYNHIFKSPYFTDHPITWSTFLPGPLWEYFAWPFLFSLDGYRVNQLQYYDLRFALFYVIAILWLLIQVGRRLHIINNQPVHDEDLSFELKYGNFLLLFFLLAYFLWIRESATYRFMIPLELLVPLCFLVLLERMVRSGNLRAMLAVGAVCLTLIYFRPFNWGRLDWDDSYFSLDTSRLDDTADPLVIMLGSSPTSYVVPQFPSNYRFVRPEGNLFGGRNSEKRNSYFFVEIENLLKQHDGELYLLFDRNEKEIQLEQSLENLGLDLAVEDCFILKINTPDELEFCHLSAAP